MTSGLFPVGADHHSFSTSEKKWTVDKIIQKIFPILGIILIASGLGYFFYTGFWDNIAKPGRLAFGFLAGSIMILGGYSFEKKLNVLHHLKYFADSIIGGGILLLYVTLIYGARFDIASTFNTLVFPESFALFVSFLFSSGVAFYALARRSVVILMIGILGAYLTPFFIGQIGGFDEGNPYEISYLQFLFYFLAINISLLLASLRLNILSLVGGNILGLFSGTLVISGMIGDGMMESPFWVSFIAFVIVLVQILFVTFNLERFMVRSPHSHVLPEQEEDTSFLGFAYLAPFLWIVIVIFGALDTSSLEIFPDFSFKALILASISALYFFAWSRLNDKKNIPSSLLFVLYGLGFFSGGIAFFNISDLFGGYVGILVSALSFVFVFLYLLSPRPSREVAFLATAIIGFFLSFLEYKDSSLVLGVFHLETLITSISLVPFLSHFIMKKREDLIPATSRNEEGAVYFVRKVLGALSLLGIVFLLGGDIVEDLDLRKDFLFATLPAGILAIVAFFHKDIENKKLLINAALAFLLIGYFITFFSFWDKLFPAHSDLPFSTSEGYIGFFSLCIALFLVFIIKKKNEVMESSGLHFVSVITLVIIAFQFVSFEIIAFYNVLVAPTPEMIHLDQLGQDRAAAVGLRAVLISFWWVLLSSFLLFLGIKNSDKYLQEKRIGMTLLAFTLGKILLYDIAHLETDLKVLLFVITGVMVLGLSYFLNVQKKQESHGER